MRQDAFDEINTLLKQCQQGQAHAQNKLFNLLYPELKRIASYKLYQQSFKLTAQTTEIVHDLYLKFSKSKQFPAKSRRYFFSIAAKAMEQIIIDHARRRSSIQRGGDIKKLSIDEQALPADQAQSDELLELSQTFKQLRKIDATAASILSLKLFSGMKTAEISITLDVPMRTIERKWALAKSHLQLNFQN